MHTICEGNVAHVWHGAVAPGASAIAIVPNLLHCSIDILSIVIFKLYYV